MILKLKKDPQPDELKAAILKALPHALGEERCERVLQGGLSNPQFFGVKTSQHFHFVRIFFKEPSISELDEIQQFQEGAKPASPMLIIYPNLSVGTLIAVETVLGNLASNVRLFRYHLTTQTREISVTLTEEVSPSATPSRVATFSPSSAKRLPPLSDARESEKSSKRGKPTQLTRTELSRLIEINLSL